MTICKLLLAVLLSGMPACVSAHDPVMPGEMCVPLMKGFENEAFDYGGLRFEPVNLFVSDRDGADGPGQIMLEYRIMDGEREAAHSRLYGGKVGPGPNIPRGWNNLLLDLGIDGDDNVTLMISHLEPGTGFYIGLQDKAVVGSLTVDFGSMITGWTALPEGGAVNDFRRYEVILTDGEDSERFVFPPVDEDPYEIIWNGRQVSVTGTYENHIRIVYTPTVPED